MNKSKILLLASIAILFLVYLFFPQIALKRTQSLSATVYSMNSRGIKIFNEIAKELGTDISIQKSPLFENSSIAKYEAIFLLSPNKSYSEKEINKIVDFVENGGSLFLLIENKVHLKYFERLL
ncbi:DUF4350 domain-containing protein, partial [Bacteriovoracaceae bacterium]|nr:DUF4350 domain-containing protein [Bacteriovoracaceae bacterium]